MLVKAGMYQQVAVEKLSSEELIPWTTMWVNTLILILVLQSQARIYKERNKRTNIVQQSAYLALRGTEQPQRWTPQRSIPADSPFLDCGSCNIPEWRWNIKVLRHSSVYKPVFRQQSRESFISMYVALLGGNYERFPADLRFPNSRSWKLVGPENATGHLTGPHHRLAKAQADIIKRELAQSPMIRNLAAFEPITGLDELIPELNIYHNAFVCAIEPACTYTALSVNSMKQHCSIKHPGFRKRSSIERSDTSWIYVRRCQQMFPSGHGSNLFRVDPIPSIIDEAGYSMRYEGFKPFLGRQSSILRGKWELREELGDI